MEETGGASAYGASLAGGGFDIYKFIRQPQTIVRVLSWVSRSWCFKNVQRFKWDREKCLTWPKNRCAWPGALTDSEGWLNYIYIYDFCWLEQQATVCSVSTGRHVACSWCMTAARWQHRSTLLLSEDKRQKIVRHTVRSPLLEANYQLNIVCIITSS